MKKLFFLDESEKERILNMHRDATKKHYLIENQDNQELLDENFWEKYVKPGLKRVGRLFTGSRTHYGKKLIDKLKTNQIMNDAGQILLLGPQQLIPATTRNGLRKIKYQVERFDLEKEIEDLFKSGKSDSDIDLVINSINSKLKGRIIKEPNKFEYVLKDDPLNPGIDFIEGIETGSNTDKYNFELNDGTKITNLPKTEDVANIVKPLAKSSFAGKESEKLTNRIVRSIPAVLTLYLGGLGYIYENFFVPLSTRLLKNNSELVNKLIPEVDPIFFKYKICNDFIPNYEMPTAIVTPTNSIDFVNDIITIAKNGDTGKFYLIQKKINETSFSVLMNHFKTYEIQKKRCPFEDIFDAFPYYYLSLVNSQQKFFTKYVMNPFKLKLKTPEVTENENKKQLKPFFEKLDAATITSSQYTTKTPDEKLKEIQNFINKPIKDIVNIPTVKNNIENNCVCRFANLINHTVKNGEEIKFIIYYNGIKNKMYNIAFTSDSYKELISSECGSVDKDNFLKEWNKNLEGNDFKNKILPMIEKLRNGTDIGCSPTEVIPSD
jgi:hypothetical protein